jgi:hypothetical protein
MQILRGRLLQFPFGAGSLKSAARRCRPRAAKGETKKIAQRQFIPLPATGGGLLAVVRFIHRAEQTTGEITHSPNGWANSSSFQFGIDFLFAEAVYHFACCVCLLFLATMNTREIVFLRPLSHLSFPLQHSHTSVSCVSVAKRATQRSKLFALVVMKSQMFVDKHSYLKITQRNI